MTQSLLERPRHLWMSVPTAGGSQGGRALSSVLCAHFQQGPATQWLNTYFLKVSKNY